MKQQTGLTLIELMITLVVISIIAAFAAPSFKNSIERNRVSASLQELGASIKYARSEAVKRSSSVTICASSNQTSCTGTWSQGWIVFKDVDAAGDFDAGTDELLRVQGAVTDGHILSFDGVTGTYVTFSSRGYTAGQNGTFKLCNKDKVAAQARGMVLQATGSLRYSIDSNADGIHENAAGTNFSCS